MEFIVSVLVGIIVAATPLVFAALGELVVEKSGVLNLGVEGMMIIGAIAGFAAMIATGSRARRRRGDHRRHADGAAVRA